MGCQWPGMGRELLQVPQLAAVIRKCHDTLQSEKFDLLGLLENDSSDAFADPLNSFVGICAIQVIDLLCVMDKDIDDIQFSSVS